MSTYLYFTNVFLNWSIGQLETLIECNAENKDILVKQLSQQNETLEIRTHFPVQTEEKLEEMNERITSENKQDYVWL